MDHLSDAELKAMSLNMWANHIETGHVGMSARDVHQQLDVVRTRPEDFKRLGFSLKALQPSQEALVARLRALSETVQAEQKLKPLVKPEVKNSFQHERQR